MSCTAKWHYYLTLQYGEEDKKVAQSSNKYFASSHRWVIIIQSWEANAC